MNKMVIDYVPNHIVGGSGQLKILVTLKHLNE